MIDEMDNRIIEILERDALLSSKTIAQMVNTSAATIRRRVAKLVKDGVIKIVAKVSPDKVAPQVTIGVGMQVNTDNIDAAATKLASHPNVKQVAFTTGEYNFQVLMTFPSTTDFSEFLQTYIPSIAGVKVVETHIFIKKWGG